MSDISDKLRGIDLHIHSNASDGTFPPAEIVRRAHAQGLAAISITDHDTVGGQAQAQEASKERGVAYLTGIELSTIDAGGKYHMLGYGYDPANAALLTRLEDVRLSRSNRNTLIMRQVQAVGLDLTLDDVMAEVGPAGDVVGRPHIAAAMIKKGIAGSTQEAFDRYLGEGRPLYFPKDALTAPEAVALIHGAGGIAVMAHPSLTSWYRAGTLAAQLADAKGYGLDGIEVYYSQHTQAQTADFIALADRLGLVKTGGSDFHGAPKPHVLMGVVYGGGPAPLAVLDEIQAALHRPI